MDCRAPRFWPSRGKYAGVDIHQANETGASVTLGYEPAPLRAVARLDSYPWFVVGTVCIGAFMSQVDASIAQLVLPELELEFHARVGAVAWVSIAYLLVVAAMLPVFGRLADMLGRKLMYCSGFLIFVAGSALCGLAPNLGLLVGARVLQGLGAGLLQANSVAIIVAAAGAARRGRALGLQSAAQAVGLSVGPALGGFLIDALGWRWVFWINVPVGLLGALLGILILPRTLRSSKPGRFDLAGAALLVPAVALLLLALNEGSRAGFGSPQLIGLVLAAVALLIGFVWREQRMKSPLIDLTLFRNLGFVTGNAAGLLSYAILFGAFFVLPFLLERGYGESALTAGLRLTVIPVTLGLVAPVSGALYDRLGPRFLTTSGMLAVLGSMVVLSFAMNGDARLLPLAMAAFALFGIGQGLFVAPNNSAIMGSATAAETGQAGGLLNVMRALGMSFGISLASVILARRLPVVTGRPPTTVGIPAQEVIRGAIATFVAFGVLAGVAALLSLMRTHRQEPQPEERAALD
jgi:EmrB/QacA subfamily drug resistance transporter